MNILRRPKLERDAVDDVLQLSTSKNLEHHADIASSKATQLLQVAEDVEKKNAERLDAAKKNFQLSRAQREAKEKLVDSVISVLKKLRK